MDHGEQDQAGAGDIDLQTHGRRGKGARGGHLVTLTRVRGQLARVGPGREADIWGETPPLG